MLSIILNCRNIWSNVSLLVFSTWTFQLVYNYSIKSNNFGRRISGAIALLRNLRILTGWYLRWVLKMQIISLNLLSIYCHTLILSWILNPPIQILVISLSGWKFSLWAIQWNNWGFTNWGWTRIFFSVLNMVIYSNLSVG